MSAPASRSLVLASVLAAASCATDSSDVKADQASTPTTAPTTDVSVEVPPAPKPEPIPARPLASLSPLRMVVQRDPTKPIVSFRFVFRSGAVDDPAGREGLTDLTAAVMKEGGTQDLSSAELLEALFPMAAELSVETDQELTTFSGRVHKDNLPRFLKIFTDVLLHPRWDPKEFERLKTAELNGVRNYLRGEDDETLGKVGLQALVFEGHPYAHWAGGTVAGLQAATLEDVKAHAARVFTQDRLVVGLAGPIDDALERDVKQRLAALPPTGAVRVELPPAPGYRKRAWVLQKDAASTAVSAGYAWDLRRGDPDYYPMAFALSYLGEHRQTNGVLFDELREKRGLNYGDYVYVEHFVQDTESTFPLPNVAWTEPMFSLWIRPVEPQNALFAARGAVFFIKRMIDEGIPKEGFERTRGFLTGYTRLWEQTDQRRLGYAIDALLYGTPDFLEGYRKALAEMTPESVNAAIKRHLSIDRLSFVFVAKDAEGVARALRSQTPTPIRYPTPKPPEVLALDERIAVQPLPIHPELVEVHPVAGFMER